MSNFNPSEPAILHDRVTVRSKPGPVRTPPTIERIRLRSPTDRSNGELLCSMAGVTYWVAKQRVSPEQLPPGNGPAAKFQRNQVHARSIGTVSGHGAAAERFYDAVKKTLDVVKVGRSDRWLGYGDRADPSIRTGSILPSTRARNRMKLTAGIGTSRHRPEARSMLSARRPRRRRLRRRGPRPPPLCLLRSASARPRRQPLVSREIRGPFLREREPSCRRQSPKRRATAPSPRDVGRSHRIAPSIPAREHRRDAVRRRTRRPMQPRRQARRRLRPRRRG